MNDIQKKLDELIAIKNSLEGHSTEAKLDIALTVSDSSVYGMKLRKIAKKYKRVSYANITNFNTQIDELQRLSIENTINYTRKTEEITTASTNSLDIILDKINLDIKTLTIELARVTTIEEIRNLCNTAEFTQKFLEIYLTLGTDPLINDALTLTLLNIKSRCDWHYPALQINALSKEWIDCMVVADPLYIICHHPIDKFGAPLTIPSVKLNDIIKSYTTEYQHRLRIYELQNQNLSILPQEQFGCIACCGFLNCFGIDNIKLYLTSFNDLLRSGGTLICTLQFSRTEESDKLVSDEYFKYTIDLIIQRLFKDTGFEVITLTELPKSNCPWIHTILIEARKPGALTTIKAHQVLGAVIEK